MVGHIDKHVVGLTFQAWGHARPLAILLSRFVKIRPAYATLLTHDAFFDRVRIEVARCFEPHEKEYAERIRVISLGHADSFTSAESERNFKHTWEKLVSGGAVVCEKTKTQHSKLPKPQAILVDLFAVDPFRIIKAVSGDTVKVFTWHAALTYEMFPVWAPERYGGKGNLRVKVEEEVRRSGRPYAEVAIELTWGGKGEVVQIPAFPPMYDHELNPQNFPVPDLIGYLIPRLHETFEASDGVFLFTAESFEPEAVAAVRRWYGETSRPAYVSGPLLPTGSQATANEKKQSKDSLEIEAFLEATLTTSGERSLLYIALGSIFWPVTAPEKMWAVLDVAMELGIPFILSHASPLAVVPDDIRLKVKAYGKGIISAWTPQQMILDHPATGWFISHGGHNGVLEAVSAGVPQIIWPFLADQPLNAIHMADTLKIGYELIEVRTGDSGLHPIYRNGKKPTGAIDALKAELRDVLEKAFGEDGARRRDRLLALRERIIREWDDGGAAHNDAISFLDSL